VVRLTHGARDNDASVDVISRTEWQMKHVIVRVAQRSVMQCVQNWFKEMQR